MASKTRFHLHIRNSGYSIALLNGLRSRALRPTSSKTYELVDEPDCNFNSTRFFDLLKTSKLGNTVITASRVTSTFDVLKTLFQGESFFNEDKENSGHGLLILAEEQTKGQGRCNNEWSSPKGSLLFTVRHVTSSPLHLSLIQHMAGLALVMATRDVFKLGCLRVKWPNDLWYVENEKGRLKVGGVLVRTSVYGRSRFVVDVGIGLNLNNDKPTTSLSQIAGRTLQREPLLASTLNHFETLMTLMESKEGLKEALKLYHQNWMHSGQVVKVQRQLVQQNEKHVAQCENWVSAVVVGIDDFGYLMVRLQDEDSVHSVQPDCNSFDLMQGLVLPKTTKLGGSY